MYTTALLLHVLAATIWTGGHIVLSTVVLPKALQEKSLDRIRNFENGYEKIGVPALIIQVITGVILANNLIGNGTWFDFSNPIARLVSFKLLLLALTIALAADARLRIIPKLSENNLNALAWHIIPVTVVSVLFVIVGVSFRTGWFN